MKVSSKNEGRTTGGLGGLDKEGPQSGEEQTARDKGREVNERKKGGKSRRSAWKRNSEDTEAPKA